MRLNVDHARRIRYVTYNIFTDIVHYYWSTIGSGKKSRIMLYCSCCSLQHVWANVWVAGRASSIRLGENKHRRVIALSLTKWRWNTARCEEEPCGVVLRWDDELSTGPIVIYFSTHSARELDRHGNDRYKTPVAICGDRVYQLRKQPCTVMSVSVGSAAVRLGLEAPQPLSPLNHIV